MCKEMLTVHIGQAGVQASQAFWELVCFEHGISAEGLPITDDEDLLPYRGEHLEAVFYRTKAARCVPRAIIVDLEPTVVDEIRLGSYRNMWNPNNIVNQKEDAASNYARGYYTSGKSFLIVVLDRINRELERCENLSAFEIVHSFAGGTGSGFTALLYETINELYGKKFKFSLGVFPSPTVSEIMVETYNTVLHTSSTLTTEDCVIIFDNESLYKKSVDKLNVSQPTFSLMNRLISQMFSSISLSHRYRFFGSQHADVTELLTNLVPYPRIHFPVMSYSPLISFNEISHEQFDCSRLTNAVFHDDSHVIQCSLKENKFMSCCMLYRGLISPKPVIDAIAKIKSSRDINFVDWCPTGFKIGINTCPPIQIPHCEQAIGDNALCMISGNTAIRKCWGNVIRKFDMLMSKRAFVHWYVAEGLEEGEFLDSRDNIHTLMLDYEELSNQSTDSHSNDVRVKSNDIINNIPTNKVNVNSSKIIPLNDTNRTSIVSKKDNFFKHQSNKSNLNGNEDNIDTTRNSIFEKKHSQINVSKQNKSFTNCRTLSVSRSDNINAYELLNTDNILENEQRNKHERNKTKNLEIKNMDKTDEKYLSNVIKSKRKSYTYCKKLIIPVSKNQLLKDSNISTSQSYTSSQCEFLEKYESMRNNNKGRSIRNSSSTESFKRVIETEIKTPINFIRKSKSKCKIIDQLLYSTQNKNNLNVNLYELCNNHQCDFKNMNTIEIKKSMYNDDFTKNSLKCQTSLNQLFQNENSKELEKNIETKMSQDVRVRNLNFCMLETFSCDPTNNTVNQYESEVNVFNSV